MISLFPREYLKLNTISGPNLSTLPANFYTTSFSDYHYV